MGAGRSLSLLNNSAFYWICKVHLQHRLLIHLWRNSIYKLSIFWFATGYSLLGKNLSSLQRSTVELYEFWLLWLLIIQVGGNVKMRNKLLKIREAKLWLIFSVTKLENRTSEKQIVGTDNSSNFWVHKPSMTTSLETEIRNAGDSQKDEKTGRWSKPPVKFGSWSAPFPCENLQIPTVENNVWKSSATTRNSQWLHDCFCIRRMQIMEK